MTACNGAQSSSKSPDQAVVATTVPGQFRGQLSDYWYQGKAEINTYDLQQVRYGEVHPGQITLIFVSEDFLTDRQVKNDAYANPNTTPIIKTNLIRRFTTGIYDYSQMTSVFTPTDLAKQPHTLKVTTSVQDWCGQTYTQFNADNDGGWKTELRSYFESEGDVEHTVTGDFLEDEIFNRIRTGWKELPTGERRVVPASGYLVMLHKPYAAVATQLTLGDYAGDRFTDAETLKSYTISYPSLERTVEIVFSAAPPYVIRGWTETYPSRGKSLTTVATLKEQVVAPYWSQNSLADTDKRATLGL
ncbi:hypothetical protein [Neolewinella antarctica]|uniref:Septum formation inhibitor Maf n=1 Tax=Neolewinella antarctica TaxID=442734 RepID=A0ABX0X853_9BACT|nr:hypothetical protein [Neolewinella antarctica]NJC25405.1 hypothetical protein [Neolewinella antarctica]